jgi:hypothetical protein
MSNQAIALQARAPQNDFMGRAIQQNAQMMNMLAQQRVAERTAAKTAQEMEFARAAEGRAAAEEGRKITQFEIEQADRQFEYHGKRATVVNTPQGYEMWLAGVGKDSREMADFIRANLPPEQFSVDPERGRDLLIKLVGSLKQNFDATYGPKESQVQIGVNGVPQEIVTGGFGKPGAYPIQQYELAPQGADDPPAAAPAASGASARPTQGTATAPADLRAQGVDPRSIPSGNPLQPISMTTGPQMSGQPDLTGIVEQMMSSGQISQSNLQLMRDAAGPDKDAQLAEILKANNIQIVPDEQPSLRSAVFRPGEDAAPQMQQVQAREGYVPTGRAARVKDPMQSPSQVPGSAGAVTGATTAASEGVRIQTQPKIVAGEERVKRIEKLRGEVPRALSETQALVDNIDERIRAIDEFLRNPYRGSVIGAIEGRLPRMLQDETRADVQALFDTIVSNSVLNKLIEDRQQTETGASPQGLVSDRDLAVAAQAANRLTQTGSERQQEIEMQRLRDILYRTRQRAVEKYNVVYREVLPETPELRLSAPSISPKYRAKPQTKTPTRRGAPQSGWGKAEVVGD